MKEAFLKMATGSSIVIVLAFLWRITKELGKDYFQGVPR